MSRAFTHLTAQKLIVVFLKMNKNSEEQTQNMTQTCNDSMLNNTNILYVFNPILTNVFAADL